MWRALLHQWHDLIQAVGVTPNERQYAVRMDEAVARAIVLIGSQVTALINRIVDSQVPELIPTGPGSPGFPRISPDGNWVIYPSWCLPRNQSIDARPTRRRIRRSWSRGSTIPALVIVRADPVCRALTLNRVPTASRIFSSITIHLPDRVPRLSERRGRRLAWSCLQMDHWVATISREPAGAIEIRSRSGELKRTIRIDGWPKPAAQDWAADGKSFFVSHPGLMNSPSGPIGATVLHVDFNGHRRTYSGYARRTIRLSNTISRRQVYATRGATTARNAWLLENF